MQQLAGLVRRCIDDYNMIDRGETIAIGMSGGKDSLALLYAMADLRRYHPTKFNLHAVTLLMGFDGMDFTPIRDICANLDIPYTIKQTNIARVVFDEREEKKRKRLEKLDETITVKTKAAATVAEVDAMGKPALLGGFNVSADEMGKLKTLAKKAVTADERVSGMKRRLTDAESERDQLKAKFAAQQKLSPTMSEKLKWFDKFIGAMRRAPKRLMVVIDEILRNPPEQDAPERSEPTRKKTQSMDRS